MEIVIGVLFVALLGVYVAKQLDHPLGGRWAQVGVVGALVLSIAVVVLAESDDPSTVAATAAPSTTVDPKARLTDPAPDYVSASSWEAIKDETSCDKLQESVNRNYALTQTDNELYRKRGQAFMDLDIKRMKQLGCPGA